MDVNLDSKPIKAVRIGMDWWQTAGLIITALGGGLIVIIVGLRDYILARIERWTKDVRSYYASQFSRMLEFSQALEEIKEIQFVERLVLMRAKNGGGKPSPGKPYTAKAIQGWTKLTDPQFDPLDIYNFEIPIHQDPHFGKLILKMLNGEVAAIKIDDLPDESIMKRLYQRENIVETRLYLIAIVGDEMLYASIASYSAGFTVRQAGEIDTAVERLRACFP